MLITLQDQGYTVTINTIGAELQSYQDPNGKEFIWDADPIFWKGSSPLLFPSIGNVRNGKTIINDVEYEMPKHGLVRRAEFSCDKQSENKAVFLYTSNEETLKHFPFTFELYLAYELKGSELYMDYKVVNTDKKEMYYHIGAHPAFMCPLEDGEEFTDYVLRFEKEETCYSPVYDFENLCFSTSNFKQHLNHSNIVTLDYKKFDNDALVFEHMTSRSVQVVNPKTNKGVQVDYPDFVTVAFWTPDHQTAPFICVEPWNGGAIYADEGNVFKNKRDIQTLTSGNFKSYHLKIKLLGY